MSTNTTEVKPDDRKQETASCCGGKADATQKLHQHEKPQAKKAEDKKAEGKSSCCCK